MKYRRSKPELYHLETYEGKKIRKVALAGDTLVIKFENGEQLLIIPKTRLGILPSNLNKTIPCLVFKGLKPDGTLEF